MSTSFCLTSSIDLAPKFLISSRSCSLRPTSSPTVWMPSRFRQLYERTVRLRSSIGRARSAALAADLALPIEDLNLTVRSYNCLKREGIHTVGELVGRSEQDLLDIRNFGAKSIEEVKQKLVDMGLSLKDSPPGFDPSSAVGAYSDDDDSYVETE